VYARCMDALALRALSGPLSAALLSAALLSAALAVALPAQAQMYKWVDERGQVTYSNTPPPNATRSNKLGIVEERVSVYSPDPQVNRALSEEASETRDSRASRRQREQADAERRENAGAAAKANADRRAAQQQAAYDRCVAERRVECESIKSGVQSDASYGYTSGPQYILVPGFVPPRGQQPFRVLDVPDSRVGINNTPPVGISTAPRAGISTAPPVGIDDRPPVGGPPRTRGNQFR